MKKNIIHPNNYKNNGDNGDNGDNLYDFCIHLICFSLICIIIMICIIILLIYTKSYDNGSLDK